MRKIKQIFIMLVALLSFNSVAMAVTIQEKEQFETDWSDNFKSICNKQKIGDSGACKSDDTSKACLCRKMDAAISCKKSKKVNCGNEVTDLEDACTKYNNRVNHCNNNDPKFDCAGYKQATKCKVP